MLTREFGVLYFQTSPSGLSEYGVSPSGLGAHHVPHMVKVGKLMLHFIKIDIFFGYWENSIVIGPYHSAKLGISRLTGGPSKPWGFGLTFSCEKLRSWEQQSSSKLRHSTASTCFPQQTARPQLFKLSKCQHKAKDIQRPWTLINSEFSIRRAAASLPPNPMVWKIMFPLQGEAPGIFKMGTRCSPPRTSKNR